MLRDGIVWVVYDERLKETLRSKPSLSLQETIDVCKAIEATSKISSGGSDDCVLKLTCFGYTRAKEA